MLRESLRREAYRAVFAAQFGAAVRSGPHFCNGVSVVGRGVPLLRHVLIALQRM